MTHSAENVMVQSSDIDSSNAEVAATLGTWWTYDWRHEVKLDQLSSGDEIVVSTLNHAYHIVVTSPRTGDVLVRGGCFFPEFAPARLPGCSLGGSVLKLGSLNVGFRLEFTVDGRRPIITTPVQTLRVVRAVVAG